MAYLSPVQHKRDFHFHALVTSACSTKRTIVMIMDSTPRVRTSLVEARAADTLVHVVNESLFAKLSYQPPYVFLITRYLEEIAKVYRIQ